MDKADRLEAIKNLLIKKGSVRVSDIAEMLNVTDMTVRRDFAELEEKGILTRTHGGAVCNIVNRYTEVSHDEKHTYNIEEKMYIAKKAAGLIKEGETIYLGPGTTVEMLASEINNEKLQIVTNCLPVFNILTEKITDLFRVYLLGGEKRLLTETFVGEITYTTLNNMKFTKAFFGANGIKGNEIMTSNYQEAFTQTLALNNSIERYLLIDSTKINKEDFISFYKLSDLSALITNEKDQDLIDEMIEYTRVIN